MDCPSSDQIRAFIDGQLSQVDWSRIKTHVDGCGRCSSSVDGKNETVVVSTPAAGHYSEFFSIEGYNIHEEIHRGGQGIVFRGTQKSTSRDVALKVLLYGRFSDEHQRNRLKREMALVATLRHPNIVTLYDSGADGPSPYLAMEYIEGQPLHRYLHQNPIPRDDRLRLFLKICDAVSYAHQKGIIHRDLKPGNIQVDENGEPFVLDFGLAKVLDPTLGGAAETLTTTGAFVGTPAYASPEQARSERHGITERTDVYSLGIILYEMLTGQYPYEVDGSATQIVKQICDAIPRKPSTRNSAIGDELDRIVLKAIEKKPERRYTDAAHLAADVRRYLAGAPIEAKRVPLYRLRKNIVRYRIPLTVGAIVMALGIVVFCQHLANRAFSHKLETWNRFFEEQSRSIPSGRGETTRVVPAPDEVRRRSGDSISFLKEAIRNDPKNARYWGLLGKAYILTQEFPKAIERFERAIELNPLDAEMNYNLGYAHLILDQFSAAKAPIEKALSLDDGMTNAWINLGYARERLNEFFSAVDAYQKAVDLDPGNMLAFRGLARNYGSTGRFHDARKAYQMLVENNPDDGKSWWGLAYCHVKLNDFDKAIECLKEAEDKVADKFVGSVAADLAVVRYYGIDKDAGIAAVREVMERFPRDDMACAVLARFWATIPQADQEDRRLALDLAAVVLHAPNQALFRNIQTTICIAQWHTGNLEAAKRAAGYSIDQDDDHAWPLLILTAVAVEENQWQDARRWRDELAQEKPKDKYEWKLFERILTDVDQVLIKHDSLDRE